MEGLYVQKIIAEHTTLHLLRFYTNGYVIYKSITGNAKDYVAKELRQFAMEGHVIKGQQEFTFCGACDSDGPSLRFKVENEVADPSNSWTPHDVFSFAGTVQEDGTLNLTRIKKSNKHEMELLFTKTTDAELLNTL